MLPAYTLNGYLPCTTIKKEWFNEKELYDWIANQLLSQCNAFSVSRSVIIMNNVSIHVNPRIKKIIEGHDCQVRYLPPYSPDFNPIELTFAVLKICEFTCKWDSSLIVWKTWIRRHFTESWPLFEGNFEDWLKYAIKRSKCDTYATQHFKHSTYGRIIFEVDMQEINRQLTNGEMQLENWLIIMMLRFGASMSHSKWKCNFAFCMWFTYKI